MKTYIYYPGMEVRDELWLKFALLYLERLAFVFTVSEKSGLTALLETLRHHWREVLIAAGLKVVETAPFYIFSTFVVSYAVNSLAYEKGVALHAVMLGALVATGMIPLMGALSDRVGRKAVYIGGILGLALFIVPYFMLLDTRAGWGITLATVIGFGVLWAPITAVLGTLSSEIFATRVRYTGITLGYQLGAALAGGTAPQGADRVILTGLRNGRRVRAEIDVADLFVAWTPEKDVAVMAGDTLYVHRAPQFYVYGEVQRAGAYRVERQMTVLQALSLGGGLSPRGTERGIRIHRRGEDGAVRVTNPQLNDPVQPDDVIVVREALF